MFSLKYLLLWFLFLVFFRGSKKLISEQILITLCFFYQLLCLKFCLPSNSSTALFFCFGSKHYYIVPFSEVISMDGPL
jgi:hypothetical protein